MSNEIDREGHQHIDTDRARGGATPGVARNVLVFGLILVIFFFALIYFLT